MALPVPRGLNTTPWQMGRGHPGLKGKRGFDDVVCVQNETVLTDPFKGEDLNNYVSLFKKYAIAPLYNFKEGDMQWVLYRPKARMHVLHKVFPEGIRVPDYFFGKNIVHLPTMKTDTYTTTSGAMKSAFQRAAGHAAPLRAVVDPQRRWSMFSPSSARSIPASSRSWMGPRQATARARAR